jgi:hypothetical protein
MKGRRIAAVLAVAATAALVIGSGAGAVDAKGPPCGDIKMDAFYSGDGTTAGATLFTPVATCTYVTYTVFINSSPTTAPVGAQGDGVADLGANGDFIELSTSVSDSDSTICIYSQSSIGGHVIDTAPDTGCVTLHPGETGGGSLPN